jgi:hypothetical protein
MTKYAFTFEPTCNSTEFVGPFGTYEQMWSEIISLINYEVGGEVGIGQMIDGWALDNSLEDLKNTLNIHTYCINEMSFTDNDFNSICDAWREEIKKKTNELKQNCEDEERKLYETLKKKFEG